MSVAPSVSVSSSATIKRSHSDVGSDDDVDAVPSSFRRFASRVVDVYVGDERFHFAAHEAFLFQSRELKSQYDVQNRGKKGNKKKENILNLPRDTPSEFGQLLEYLYLNRLTLRASGPQAQADELLSIWIAGTRHTLLGMQKHVIRKLEELDIAGRLPAQAFLHLADKLYESEVDNGLRRYFSTVAPGVVGKLTATDMTVLLEMIMEGGSFASDLFHAHHKAFGPGSSASATELGKTAATTTTTTTIKTEGSQQQRTATRAQTEDNIGTVPHLPAFPPSLKKGSLIDPYESDVRTEWDSANSIPVALETATPEDKLLVDWADHHKPWSAIALDWESHTHEKISIKDLKHRYERINANVLRLGTRDVNLLHLARTSIETSFNSSKWPLIAARIVEDGGAQFPPLQLQRHCDALDAAAKTKTTDEREAGMQVQSLRTSHHLASAHVPTEVVGGVRVENSKPLGVKKRKRWVPGPKNAPVVNKAGAKTKTTKKDSTPAAASASVADGTEDDSDEEMVDGATTTRDNEAEPRLFANDDDDDKLDTGVKVTGLPERKVKGNMRSDDVRDLMPERTWGNAGFAAVNVEGGVVEEEEGEEVMGRMEEDEEAKEEDEL
ncbi:MAG: hypothetical protein Q9177_006275 [Variospora cf. flavescens]